MAEAWAKRLVREGVEIWSAGSKPQDDVNPHATTVMEEVGIDLTHQHPKGVEAVPAPVDLVVTLCDSAAQDCPVFPGSKKVQHWGLPDPADATGSKKEILEVFRDSRDDIERRVKALIASEGLGADK